MRFLLVMLLSSISLFAQENLTMKQVMQLVNQSAVKVLEGFLLNNDRMVIEGAREIAEHPKPAGGPLRYIEPSKREEFVKLVRGFEEQVHGGSQRIIELMKEGKREEAFKEYFRVLQGCTACHRIFRDGR
ncbi:hypothetical protein BCF55_0679 [Hydrogenivirga caldilitoris]|uniref:Cytochrome c n=1 Tax=Hydrogenivirga caldilitoris TaxID=246264 RepID=A0A497XN87_9AQUI|nr:hypothetical protein [Hydrogenivirga caldilitoris]RLJ70407.1 hypothetical protein BCF55_0679 [Hydrogenivirga caldilitoris]